MDETSFPTAETRRLKLTRNQRYGGFVITAGMSLFAVFGIVNYWTILKDGPVVPDRSALAVREGRLLFAKRDGGKTKRKYLLIQLAKETRRFVYDPKAGEIDHVEETLQGAGGSITVLYHPKDFAVYEIRQGDEVLRSYDQITKGYKKSLTSHAHVRGILAMVLLVATIAMAIALARMKPTDR